LFVGSPDKKHIHIRTWTDLTLHACPSLPSSAAALPLRGREEQVRRKNAPDLYIVISVLNFPKSFHALETAPPFRWFSPVQREFLYRETQRV
jgi:hypothetical protein